MAANRDTDRTRHVPEASPKSASPGPETDARRRLEGPPPAPVASALDAGHPTANIPDPRGLEGAPAVGLRGASQYQVVDYTIPGGEDPSLAPLRSAGLKAGDVRQAFVVKRHDDGSADLLVAFEGGGHTVPRVFPADASAGAERSQGKWSPAAGQGFGPGAAFPRV